jgi:hypothetical protein
MTHDAQEEVPIFDYPVISDGGPKEPKPSNRWKEPAWKAVSADGFDHEDEGLGEIEIHSKGPQGSPRFEAEMMWKGHRIEVEGPVPGGDRWQGKGKAKAKGPKPEKDVDVEFENPKRWG